MQAGHGAYRSRFESLGLELPRRRLTSEELIRDSRHHPDIDIERLTGIRERHVCSEGEDSCTLAVAAARDCLAHSQHGPEDLEMLVSCSISKNKGGLRHQLASRTSVRMPRRRSARS